MLRFFYWPAVGSAITEERSKDVENEELNPLTSARVLLFAAEDELKELMTKVQESYRTLTLHTIEVQCHIQNALQELRTIE